jgi:hypothetical protein
MSLDIVNSAMRTASVGALLLVDGQKYLDVLPYDQLVLHLPDCSNQPILGDNKAEAVVMGVAIPEH